MQGFSIYFIKETISIEEDYTDTYLRYNFDDRRKNISRVWKIYKSKIATYTNTFPKNYGVSKIEFMVVKKPRLALNGALNIYLNVVNNFKIADCSIKVLPYSITRWLVIVEEFPNSARSAMNVSNSNSIISCSSNPI